MFLIDFNQKYNFFFLQILWNNKANAIEKVSSIQEYSHKHKDAGTTDVNGID